jgi:hypothetical protein
MRNDDGLTPQEEAARRYDYVRAAAGTRIGGLDIEGSPYFVSISEFSDGASHAYERIATKTGMPLELLRGHPNVLAGSPDMIADTLAERRETFGINYVTVQQAQAERFAPIVARLAGT